MKKKSKRIVNKDIPSYPITLYGLNDGRLAIGGETELVIYNMKSYKVDIKIKSKKVKFILQLKDNKLFYYSYEHDSEGIWSDYYHYNNLIELSEKEYKDKNSVLPVPSKYNILRQFSDTILFGGINYCIKQTKYEKSNSYGSKRIEKIVKDNDFEKYANIEKYEVESSLEIDFIDFTPLKNDTIAVLQKDNICFYDINKLSIKKKNKINDGKIISNFNDKFLIYGTQNNLIIFDYINYKYVKSLPFIYPIRKIYTKKNNVFIGQSKDLDIKRNKADNMIVEYEIDENGNYIQKNECRNCHNNELIDITQVNDGRIISCSCLYINIWT